MHRRQPLPRLWMMSDERQGDGILDAIARVPSGSGLVFRHYRLPAAERRRLFEDVRQVGRERQLLLMLAGDPDLAREWGADGSHGLGYGSSSGDLLRSASIHDLEELSRAEEEGVHFVFASPVFPTQSHPGAATLGPDGLATIVGKAQVPVIALGGMSEERADELDGIDIHGWAAIDAWSA